MNMKAKHNRRCPELNVGDTAKKSDKGNLSKSTNDTYNVTSISKSSGVVSDKTTAGKKGAFLGNELFQNF